MSATIKEYSKLVLFLLLILLVSLSFSSCSNGDPGDIAPETYNTKVLIEEVSNEDHTELFSILKDGKLGIDEFNYKDNTLTGNITNLSGTTNLTLVIDNNNLEDGEYSIEKEVIEVDSDNNQAKFTVEFNREKSEIASIDINDDVQDISVDYGTSEDDAIAKLADEITITDTNDNKYSVSLDWTMEYYDSEIAGDYTATGTFELPEAVKQTDPATDLVVQAIITIQLKKVDGMVLVHAGNKGGVTIDNDFYISKYNVTQEEFKDVMGFNPSFFNDKDHPDLTGDSNKRPVEYITWYDAVKYANKLSEREGFDKYYNITVNEESGDNITDADVEENKNSNGYRLPTADEHVYAARGGRNGISTTYAGSNNLEKVGWYEYNSDLANSDISTNRGTMPVGEKNANELGLYDMSGNVRDWTNSEIGSRRRLRGGHYDGEAYRCEVTYSISSYPSHLASYTGFRLLRSP